MQLPKLIALASVAVRVQWREADEHLEECTTNLMALGGVLHLDILSLPTPPSKSNGWTLRAVTPDTQFIHRCVGSIPITRCGIFVCAISLHAYISVWQLAYGTCKPVFPAGWHILCPLLVLTPRHGYPRKNPNP